MDGFGIARHDLRGPWSEASPAPDGEQYLFADSSGWSLSQSGPTITAGERYVLNVDLFPLSTGTSVASVLLRDATTGANLAGAGNFPSADPAIQQIELPDGEWTTVSVAVNADSVPTSIGRDLAVRIAGARLAVDNVRLVVDDQSASARLLHQLLGGIDQHRRPVPRDGVR